MSLSLPSLCVGAMIGLLLSGCASPGELPFFTGGDSSDTETASLTTPTESTCQTPQQCAVQLRVLERYVRLPRTRSYTPTNMQTSSIHVSVHTCLWAKALFSYLG